MDTACPVCASPPGPVREQWGEFAIRACPHCTLQYCDPLSYDRAWYQAAYARRDDQPAAVSIGCMRWLEEASDELSEFPWFLLAAQEQLLQWARGHLPAGAAMVDVGCGGGMLLGALRAAGFQAHGLELAAQPVEQLRRRGFDVVQGGIGDAPAAWRPSAVTLTEVLEHVPEPVAFLASLRQRFAEATLLLTVPSRRRWTKPFQLHDVADAPPNHLTRWNSRSLTQALTLAGYRDVHVHYPRPTALELASVSYRAMLESWRRGCHSAPVVDGGPPSRAIADEIQMRRHKARLAALPAALLGVTGHSALSLLATARP